MPDSVAEWLATEYTKESLPDATYKALLGAVGATHAGRSIQELWQVYLAQSGYRDFNHMYDTLGVAPQFRNPFTVVASGLLRGPNLIVNGDFATDTNWTKGVGWSISGGVATRVTGAGVSTGLDQTVALVTGGRYEYTFTVVTRTGGSFQGRLSANGGFGTSQSAPVTFTQTLTAAGGSTMFTILGTTAAAGTIDNISMRRVL